MAYIYFESKIIILGLLIVLGFSYLVMKFLVSKLILKYPQYKILIITIFIFIILFLMLLVLGFSIRGSGLEGQIATD